MSEPELTAEDLARIHPGWWAVLASEGEWLPFEHLQLLCRKLIEVATGEVKRLIVVMPPQHGKSETVSRWFVSWLAGAFPRNRTILATYGQDFSSEWGAKARNALADFGPSVFGVRPRGGHTAARAHWEIEDLNGKLTGGAVYAVGCGGPVVGRRADAAVLDDIHKGREDAFSEVSQAKAHEWWRTNLRTRLAKDGPVVLVTTRWSRGDLAGRLLGEEEGDEGGDGDKWEVLHLRALCEDPETDPMGRRLGEALCEELKPRAWLETTRAELGQTLFCALYQGDPVSSSGGMVKSAWFMRYEQPAPGLLVYHYKGIDRRLPLATFHRFMTCDLACSTKTTSDYSVLAVWAQGPMGELLLLDQHRARMEAPDIVPAIGALVDRYGVSIVWIESVAFQLSIVQEARRAGIPVRELRPTKDKTSRLWEATPFLEACNSSLRSSPSNIASTSTGTSAASQSCVS